MTIPNQWYYVKKNERCGPVEAAQLKQLAETGEIKGTTLVWRVGMADWIEAEQVQGLFPKPVEPGTPSITPDYQPPLSQQTAPVRPPPTQATTPQIAAPIPSPQATQSQAAAMSEMANHETPPLDSPISMIHPESKMTVVPQKASSTAGHPIGILLDWSHANIGRSFVNASTQLFTKIGFWAIPIYSATILIGSLIAAIQLQDPRFLGFELGSCILVLVLQYPAIKMLDLLGHWEFKAKVPRPFFDMIAVLACVAGVGLLIGLTFLALKLGFIADRIIFPLIFTAIGAFVIFVHLATVAISLSSNDSSEKEEDQSTAEEAKAIFGGLWSIVIRTVPVVFGTGIVLCCLKLLYSMIDLRSADESVVFTATASYGSSWMFAYLLLPAAVYLLSITLRFLGTILVNQKP